MRPLRVSTLYTNYDASFVTRCDAPLAWLERQGAIERVPALKAWTADVVILHGQWQPGALAVAQSLRLHGIRVIVDVDEEVFSVPTGHPRAQAFQDSAFRVRVRQLLEQADAVFTPTDFLAFRLAEYASGTVVIPNGMDLEPWRKVARAGARPRVKKVGFAGGASYTENLEILRPVLAQLAGEFKNKDIHFACLGCKPSWLSGEVRQAEAIPPCAPHEYPAALANLGVDIGLIPLSNSPFDQGRSALKFWEYSAAGAVTIASKTGSFAQEIEPGVNGLLVENKTEAWTQAILKLIRNDDLRVSLLQNARKSLASHDLSRTAPKLLAAIEALEPSRERTWFAMPRVSQSDGAKRNVDVVIPIYNAPVLTQQAIEAALPELNEQHRLILVDDASPDPAIGTLLDQYTGREWVTVHRSAENRGFVGTCNFAVLELGRADADVILMNSDTRPMSGFVARMAETANANPGIGTVTAVSNQGSIATVPLVSDAKELAASLDHPLVIAPVGVGHLMYVKRAAVDKYGLFDMAFSPGYGEEVDFCLRIASEYASVIDTGCWCWHKGSASFREAVTQLRLDHDALINQRHPHFPFLVEAYHATDPLFEHRQKILISTRDPRPKVMHVAHSYEGGGGTEKHVQDLEGMLSDQFLQFAFAPHDQLKLYSNNVRAGAWPYIGPNWPMSASKLPPNDDLWMSLLDRFKPDVIHFHHLLNHSLGLLAKLISSGIPVVVSVHDYFFLCPDYTLQNCPGVHSCDSCFPELFKGPAEYQALRRQLLGQSLAGAAVIIAPSQAAKNLVREVYPHLEIQVISHGIHGFKALERKPAAKIRFGMVGNTTPVKGADILLQVWPRVPDAYKAKAEFHVYGACSRQDYLDGFQRYGIHYHGPYREVDLPRIMSEIDIGVLPSQQPETFCYALDEFFAGGVPVIGSDYGALSERITEGVNGLKVPRKDIGAWVATIERAIDDTDLRQRIAAGVKPPSLISGMAKHYAVLYREMAERNRQSQAASESPQDVKSAPKELAMLTSAY